MAKGKIMKMKVDLGDYGEETLDFSKDFEVSTIDEALLKQASIYDWYDSVYQILKKQSEAKTRFLKATSARRREELEGEIKEETGKKKVTQKELDAALLKDPAVLTVKEELADLNYKVNRVKGHLSSLSQFHSNLKELSRRERWRLSSTSEDDVEERARQRVGG